MQSTPGSRLAQLMLRGSEAMTDEVVAELARRGHPGLTASLGYAMRAIGEGADDVAGVGRRLDVSKQAAAKTVGTLERLGYVVRRADPEDGRRRLLELTDRGREMFAVGGAAFDDLRQKLVGRIGARRLRDVEEALEIARSLRISPAPTSAVDSPSTTR